METRSPATCVTNVRLFVIVTFAVAGIIGCKRATVTADTRPNAGNSGADSLEQFYRAALKPDRAEMGRLLSGGFSANAKDRDGDPLLGNVALLGCKEAVDILLDHGAEINASTSSGRTALSLAVEDKQTDIVRLLLDRGADPNVGIDTAPLYYAADTETCSLLLAHRASINGPDHAKKAPLHSAAEVGHLDVVKVLLRAGANVLAVDSGGLTPVIRAAQNGQWDCVTFMVESGGNVSEFDRSDDNKTALHYAALAHELNAIKALVARGAPRDAVDQSGRTPIDYARTGGWNGTNASEIFQLLAPR